MGTQRDLVTFFVFMGGKECLFEKAISEKTEIEIDRIISNYYTSKVSWFHMPILMHCSCICRSMMLTYLLRVQDGKHIPLARQFLVAPLLSNARIGVHSRPLTHVLLDWSAEWRERH